jgi:hypothetical protein
LRDQSLKAASANVAVGHYMSQKVLGSGVSAECIHVIPNWSDDDQICPIDQVDNPFRRDWG